jgi:hypothetical protein
LRTSKPVCLTLIHSLLVEEGATIPQDVSGFAMQ